MKYNIRFQYQAITAVWRTNRIFCIATTAKICY